MLFKERQINIGNIKPGKVKWDFSNQQTLE